MRKLLAFYLVLFGMDLSIQEVSNIQFTQKDIDCSINQMYYPLRGDSSADNWTIYSQNAPVFFDDDLMKITTFRSLFSNNSYGVMLMDMNKYTRVGQSNMSPLIID